MRLLTVVVMTMASVAAALLSPASSSASSSSSSCRAAAFLRAASSHHRSSSKLNKVARYLSTTNSAAAPPPPQPTQPQIQYYHNDVFRVDMPPGHRFPMEKYEKFRRQTQQRLRGSGINVAFHPSPLASLPDLATTHEMQYIQRYLTGRVTPQEQRESGFPWNRQHVNRTLSSVGGTVAAMHSLFTPSLSKEQQPQVAAHLAGGTHHAFHAKMEGFCIFSDIAVAANVCLRDYKEQVSRILIVDLDVHQGNGNAQLFASNDRVFTFSMHCDANYFSQKQHSDLDVEVPAGVSDETYLQLLSQHLDPLFEQHQPDLVFFQAGVDILGADRLGRLELTREGLQERNLRVYKAVEKYKTKLVICAGGGYPSDSDPASGAYQSIIDSHADVYVGAAEFWGGHRTLPLRR